MAGRIASAIRARQSTQVYSADKDYDPSIPLPPYDPHSPTIVEECVTNAREECKKLFINAENIANCQSGVAWAAGLAEEGGWLADSSSWPFSHGRGLHRMLCATGDDVL